MRQFGAKEFAKLIYSAKKIYDENRADLEKDRDDEEFMAMYEQYEAFDELEEQFMDMEELVTVRIAEYVDNHIEEFAEIVWQGLLRTFAWYRLMSFDIKK